MRHFLRGLAALIEEGRIDEALERIDELCETNDRTAVRRYCANDTVNIVLSSFSSDINRNGITADLRAAVPESVHVADRYLKVTIPFPVAAGSLQKLPARKAAGISHNICSFPPPEIQMPFPPDMPSLK